MKGLIGLLALALGLVVALDNGLGRTPQMGESLGAQGSWA